MKRLFIILLSVLSFQASQAQVPQKIASWYVYNEGGYAIRQQIPKDTVQPRTGYKDSVYLAAVNDVLYLWSPSQKKFVKAGGGADSSVFLTKYAASSLYAPLSGYNKTSWDLAYSWGNHASAGYLKGVDTASISNRINQKVNYTDTVNGPIATRAWVQAQGYGNGAGTATPPTITASSATSLSLTTATTNEKTYVFTGTAASTWTLPAVSTASTYPLNIKNRGTANITLQRAGSDQLYTTAATNSITIFPGDAVTVQSDSNFWIIY